MSKLQSDKMIKDQINEAKSLLKDKQKSNRKLSKSLKQCHSICKDDNILLNTVIGTAVKHGKKRYHLTMPVQKLKDEIIASLALKIKSNKSK